MSEQYELMRVPVEQDRAVALRELARAEVVDPAQYMPSSSDRLADTAPVTEGWADVPLVPLELDDTPPAQRRRPARILVIAAALVAIVVTALVLVRGNDDPTSKVPADQPATSVPTTVAEVTQESLQPSDRRLRESAALRIGFAGLPPVGARPSTPERGILALAIWRCTSGPWFDGLSVFTDGRLIWGVSGRMLEQRLTPEGVELMRSELLGSGLLDTHNDDECGEASYYGHIEVGDEMGSEFGAPIDDVRIARLADPWSWLPESAWADREIKAFVPSEYSVLITAPSEYGIFTPGGGPPSGLAAVLPAAAQELALANVWECQSGGIAGYTTCYTGMTTDEVRALAAALDAAGFDAGIDEHAYLEYHDETSIRVDVRPRLPNDVGVGPIPG